MYPMYRGMEAFPNYHGNQMSCAPVYYHPSYEIVPPQAKVDPFISPGKYEASPYGSSSSSTYGGYPSYPMQCHGCCNHNYHPIGFRGHPPHFPCPSSPCHGALPVFPGTFPSSPYAPPHYYSMEQPRYEYNKWMPIDHRCCGCANHPCHRQGQLKIGEQHDAEGKRGNSISVPLELKDYPYPVVWIPPGYKKNKDQARLFESGSEKPIEDPQVLKPMESLNSSKFQPTIWNGWFPFDMNNFKSLKQGGDVGGDQNEQKNGKGQVPFPIIWIPNEPEGGSKKEPVENNAVQESIEQSPSQFNTVPIILDSNDMEKNLSATENDSGRVGGLQKMEECPVQKMIMIPVEQTEQEEEKAAKSCKGNVRAIPVKQGDNIEEKNPSEIVAKRRSSSPPKSPKLPPVCLRVDPLPRKKKSSGNSRSRSPPGHKEKLQDPSNDDSRLSTSSNTVRSEVAEKSDSAEQSECKVETAVGGTGKLDIIEKVKEDQSQSSVNLPVDSCEEVSNSISQAASMARTENSEGFFKEHVGEGTNPAKIIEPGSLVMEEMQTSDNTWQFAENEGETNVKEANSDGAKTKLSDSEAAVLIQSAYRGFEVRRWEPLKKLKQISEVRKKSDEIKKHIETLAFASGKQRDDKQRVIIGETIMSLLLKLDTIQGLHPSIRDVRKSVARELVKLQEEIDSLVYETSEPCAHQDSAIKPKEDTSDGVQSQEGIDIGNGKSDGCNAREKHHVESNLDEPLEMQPVPTTNVVSGPESTERSETMLDDMEKHQDSKEAIIELSAASSTCLNEANAELAADLVGVKNNEDLDVGLAAQTPENCVCLEVIELPVANTFDQILDVQAAEGHVFSSKETLHKPVGALVCESSDVQEREHESIKACDNIVLHELDGKSNSLIDESSTRIEQQPSQELEEGGDMPKAEEPEINTESLSVSMEEKLEPEEEEEEIIRDMTHDLHRSSEQPELEVAFDTPELVGASMTEESRAEISILQYEAPAAENGNEGSKSITESVNNPIMLEDGVITSEQNEQPTDGIDEEKEQLQWKLESGEQESKVRVAPRNAERHNRENQDPVQPTGLVSTGISAMARLDKSLTEENEKLREIMEKMIEAGKEQLAAIANLSGRVKELEKRLSRKKKMKMRRMHRVPASA